MAYGFKTGGRQQGTPNKSSGKVRDYITQLVEDNLDQITKDIKTLEPKERVDVIVKLLPYCSPKLQAIEYTDSSEGGMSPLMERIKNLQKMQVTGT